MALTLFAAFMVTTQLPVPLHAPPQPKKVAPDAGVAVSVTLLPEAKLALQVTPQEMPAGALATLPEPVPPLVTLRV